MREYKGAMRVGAKIGQSFEVMLPPIPRFVGLCMSWTVAGLMLAIVHPLAAQTVDQIILGRLIDDATRQPISDGTIRLLRRDSSIVLSVVTDSAGRFRIATRSAGVHRLRAEHIGYATATGPELQLALRDTLRLDFHLLPTATLLSPIIVRAERTMAPYYAARGMEDFYRRIMTAGFRSALSGQFMTRDSIALWEGSTLTNMLMQFRGVDGSANRILMRNCAPRIFVEGVPYELSPGETLAQSFPPHLLEAVEVYVGQAVPAEFFGRTCGVIVFWRRR